MFFSLPPTTTEYQLDNLSAVGSPLAGYPADTQGQGLASISSLFCLQFHFLALCDQLEPSRPSAEKALLWRMSLVMAFYKVFLERVAHWSVLLCSW